MNIIETLDAIRKAAEYLKKEFCVMDLEKLSIALDYRSSILAAAY